jgi:hypothetical protein
MDEAQEALLKDLKRVVAPTSSGVVVVWPKDKDPAPAKKRRKPSNHKALIGISPIIISATSSTIL